MLRSAKEAKTNQRNDSAPHVVHGSILSASQSIEEEHLCPQSIYIHQHIYRSVQFLYGLFKDRLLIYSHAGAVRCALPPGDNLRDIKGFLP